jgi:tetratricopeptide (TPR) repeat protein
MQGNYSKATPLFIEALEIRKKNFGIENSDYATSLNNLAFLYYMEHSYSKAEPLFLKALEIRKESLGKESPEYATTLFNLGELYYKKKIIPNQNLSI